MANELELFTSYSRIVCCIVGLLALVDIIGLILICDRLVSKGCADELSVTRTNDSRTKIRVVCCSGSSVLFHGL